MAVPPTVPSAAPGPTRSSRSCRYSSFGPRTEYAPRAPLDRAQVEDVAAIRTPDVVRDVHHVVPEVTRGGLEIRQRRRFDDDVASNLPIRIGSNICLRLPFKPLSKGSTPLAQIEQLRLRVRRRRIGRAAGTLVVQVPAARGRHVDDIAANATEEVVLFEVQREAFVETARGVERAGPNGHHRAG